jgi:hypothetical protein
MAQNVARLGIDQITIGRFTLRAGIDPGHVTIEDGPARDGGDFPSGEVQAMLDAIAADATTEEAEAAVETFYTRRF